MKRLVFLFLATLGLAACVAPSAANSPVVARIGGQPITAADFERRLREDIGPGIEQLLAEGQTPEQIEQLAAEAQIRTRVFDQLIQDALLIDLARRNGIGVDPSAVDAAVPAPPPPSLGSAPALPGVEPTPTSAQLRLGEARRQLVLEVIARNTRVEMVRSRHILVGDEAAADSVLAELEAGGDFAAIARERSNDVASAEQGGELGWTPRGDFAPAFEEAAFSAPLNTPTKVQTEFGWHVVEVLERQAERAFENFARLRQSANAQTFFEQAFTPWYEEFRRQAELSGDLELAEGFDPNSVPLPFPAQ